MRTRALLAMVAVVVTLSPPARAAECGRAVVFTTPGVIWEDIARWQPPVLTGLAGSGAVGSLAVRTVTSRTSYASGFATLGAGERLDGGSSTGGTVYDPARSAVYPEGFGPDVRVAGLDELLTQAAEDDYGAVPGALAEALGDIETIAVGNSDPGIAPPPPLGYGRWALLAAMDASGVVDQAFTGRLLLASDPTSPFGVRTDIDALRGALDSALARPCALTFVDPGDLARADQSAAITENPEPEQRRAALLVADEVLGLIVQRLDLERDLLVVVSPTSPAWDDSVHFGIAIAAGPGIPPGSELTSATTKRTGVVTLVDVAPSVLDHFDIDRPTEMAGRAWTARPTDRDPLAAAIEFDREAVFIDAARPPAVTGFVAFQILVYLLIALTFWRERKGRGPPRRVYRALELATLAVIAFPAATYLLGFVTVNAIGWVWFGIALMAIDVALLIATVALFRKPLDRLLVLTAATTVLLFADLLTGSRLQVNTLLSYSQLVAGRFYGIGNNAFAVFAGATLMTGTLIVQRWRGSRWAYATAAAIFLGVVVVDGAPPFGSDVGGVITLIPALAVTLVLLAGRKPTVKVVALIALGLVAAVAAFLAFDLSRPPESRTHLARLYEDVRSGGYDVFVDTIERKIQTNLRVFTTTIWTYAVPPALVVVSFLLLRPRGRWQRLAVTYPKLRAGLIGALLLAAIGFVTNDSGIVIPAVILAYLVPTALIIHLHLEKPEMSAP